MRALRLPTVLLLLSSLIHAAPIPDEPPLEELIQDASQSLNKRGGPIKKGLMLFQAAYRIRYPIPGNAGLIPNGLYKLVVESNLPIQAIGMNETPGSEEVSRTQDAAQGALTSEMNFFAKDQGQPLEFQVKLADTNDQVPTSVPGSVRIWVEKKREKTSCSSEFPFTFLNRSRPLL